MSVAFEPFDREAFRKRLAKMTASESTQHARRSLFGQRIQQDLARERTRRRVAQRFVSVCEVTSSAAGHGFAQFHKRHAQWHHQIRTRSSGFRYNFSVGAMS
jgi:hypothetical protein